MKQTGVTRWDKACDTKVNFGETGFIRFLAGSTLVISFLTLNFVGKTLNRNERREWYAAKYHSGDKQWVNSYYPIAPSKKPNPRVNVKPVLSLDEVEQWVDNYHPSTPNNTEKGKTSKMDELEEWVNNYHPSTPNNTEVDKTSKVDLLSDKVETAESTPTDAQTQYNRGLAYYKGEGVSKNFMEAARWFRLSADQGNAEAQFYLGLLYSNGWGMTRDYTEAVKWFSISAGQGNVYAQYNLGVIYANGQGVPKSQTESAKWFRMAANQGMKEAQAQLESAKAAEGNH